jgi:hypothetical protein
MDALMHKIPHECLMCGQPATTRTHQRNKPHNLSAPITDFVPFAQESFYSRRTRIVDGRGITPDLQNWAQQVMAALVTVLTSNPLPLPSMPFHPDLVGFYYEVSTTQNLMRLTFFDRSATHVSESFQNIPGREAAAQIEIEKHKKIWKTVFQQSITAKKVHKLSQVVFIQPQALLSKDAWCVLCAMETALGASWFQHFKISEK